MVLKYIIHGLKGMKKSCTEDSTLTEILEYIERVEDFKHCTDEVQAARLLEMYKLTLDHVPGHLLKSKEVHIPKDNKNSLRYLVHIVYNYE